MSSKIKIRLDDPEIRAVWNACLEAQREVASWPAWKRGEYDPATDDETEVATTVAETTRETTPDETK